MESRTENKTRHSLNDEREMRKQLSDLGMYEEGMTFKEMKEILTVVDNSKLSVDQNSIENSTQPKLDTTLLYPSAISLIDNHSNKQLKNKDSYSESTTNDQRKKLHQVSTTANNIDLHQDEIDEKLSSYRRSDRFKGNKLESSDSKNLQELKTSESFYGIEDNYRLNLLNCKKLDSDILFKLKCSPLIRKKLTMIDGTTNIFNTTLDQQCATLNKIAMLWHKYNTKLQSCEIQWSSPIKADVANGSLDKKPYLQSDEDQEILEVHNVEGKRTRTSLRPRSAQKKYASFSVDNDDDDEDDDNDKNNNYGDDDDSYNDDIEPIVPKRKKLSTSIQKPPIKKRNTAKTKRKQIQEASIEEESQLVSINSTNSKVQLNPRKRIAKSPSPEYPDLSNSKKNMTSQPSNSRSFTENTFSNSPSNQQNLFLTNDPKEKRSNMPNVLNSDENDSMITDDEDEVIPNSQEPEQCTDRLNRSSQLLQQLKFNEKQKRQDAEVWQKLHIKSKEHEREDRIRRRVKEEKAMSLKRDEEEKKEQEQENKYRNVTTRSNKWQNTRNELNAKLPPKKDTIVVNSDDESHTMGNGDIASDEDTTTGYKNVQCPLCNNYFTSNKIESHADECASISDNIQQSSQSEENIGDETLFNSQLLTCQSCKSFCTKDSKIFQKHCSYECTELFRDGGTINDKNKTSSMTAQSSLSTIDPSNRKRKR